MEPDDYFVRVIVDGEPIPLEFHCNGNPTSSSCRFTVSSLEEEPLPVSACKYVFNSDWNKKFHKLPFLDPALQY